MLLPLWWMLRVREPERRAEGQGFQWAAFKELGKPHFLIFGAYTIWYSIVSFGVDGPITYCPSDRFLATETTVGQYGALRGAGR
jgi:hypothetical protein